MCLKIVNIGLALHVVSAAVVGGKIDKTVRNIHHQSGEISSIEGTDTLGGNNAAGAIKSSSVLFQSKLPLLLYRIHRGQYCICKDLYSDMVDC